MPWIPNDFKQMISSDLIGDQKIENVDISFLNCKSTVTNEFFNMLACQDFANTTLKELILSNFESNSMPIEE